MTDSNTTARTDPYRDSYPREPGQNHSITALVDGMAAESRAQDKRNHDAWLAAVNLPVASAPARENTQPSSDTTGQQSRWRQTVDRDRPTS